MGLALLQIIIIIFFLLESRTNIYIYIYIKFEGILNFVIEDVPNTEQI